MKHSQNLHSPCIFLCVGELVIVYKGIGPSSFIEDSGLLALISSQSREDRRVFSSHVFASARRG
jgi:hypothetical protein